MKRFRNINYGRTLYESLRNYFSVDGITGVITSLYRYVAALIQPLQPRFDQYVVFRKKEEIIARCKWQIGQLTNVLNYFYDNLLNRIFIGQAVLTVIADPMFEYPPVNFDSDFDSAPVVQEREFGDRASSTLTTINVPAGIDMDDLIATIEQIRMDGFFYTINILP